MTPFMLQLVAASIFAIIQFLERSQSETDKPIPIWPIVLSMSVITLSRSFINLAGLSLTGYGVFLGVVVGLFWLMVTAGKSKSSAG
jgi:hypothetical protein